MEILNIRKLIAVDIALHGKRFILTEFLLAVILSPILSLLVININPTLGWYVALL